MITHLNGQLISQGLQALNDAAYLVIDVQGVGYYIHTSHRCLAQIEQEKAVGDDILIHTLQVFRQDDMRLIGFLNREERDLFALLQGSSGVGIKVTLALLSTLTVSDIVQAIVSGEYRRLTDAKGVGPKLAQKMTLDLKEKLTQWQQTRPPHVKTEGAAQTIPDSPSYQETETVLLSLGYTHHEILNSLKAIASEQPKLAEKNCDAEILLRESLRWLAKH
jgi:Holliday junction DNA helicase RuvA